MKKTRLALAIATTAMASTPVLATNGDNMIGLGAKEISMGGTGAAGLHGAEGILNNASATAEVQGTEFNIAGTLFMPTIKTKAGGGPVATGEQTSKGDTYLIPAVSTATRINDNLVFGIGMWGTAGMGTDYSQKNADGYGGQFDLSSNLQLMKFAPSLTYQHSNFAIGVAPVLQYGALDIQSDTSAFGGGNNGAGQSTDLGWGYTLGASYKIGSLKIGAAYDSAIDMKYEDQISTQITAFKGLNPGITMTFDDHLEQPAQIKVGVAYDIGAFQIAADYKNIQWGDAKGYKDFGWENQNVYSLGVKFIQEQYWLAVGYNYGENPIDEKDASTSANNAAKNFFNMALFPATSESQFTFGGGYSLTQNMALDAAIMYAPQTKNTYDTTALGIAPSVTTKHEEMSYTVQLSYKF
ncbi:MAG: OmpP1/FadL family transporter [Hydrogenovibrio sp.]